MRILIIEDEFNLADVIIVTHSDNVCKQVDKIYELKKGN